jgi:hypothetical protein
VSTWYEAGSVDEGIAAALLVCVFWQRLLKHGVHDATHLLEGSALPQPLHERQAALHGPFSAHARTHACGDDSAS